MHAEPTPQHQWLKKFVGEWTYEVECSMEPGGEPMRFQGTESVRALGDLWIIGDMLGEMPDGQTAHMMITVGFNPGTGRFVGTFLGTPDAHLWIYDGSLDEANNELTLEAEGPSMTEPGQMRKYRDITRFVSDDERQFRSEILGDEGQWTPFMTSTFKRKA